MQVASKHNSDGRENQLKSGGSTGWWVDKEKMLKHSGLSSHGAKNISLLLGFIAEKYFFRSEKRKSGTTRGEKRIYDFN